MFKKIITHTKFKNAYFGFLILFTLLFVYHAIRYYIVQPDCDFITGRLNRYIEEVLAYVCLTSLVLTVIQIIANAILKNGKWILINVATLITIIGLFYLFFSNTFLECLFHGLNFNLNGV